MLVFGIAVAFALAAADRARRREASAVLWGALAGVVCVAAGIFGGLILVIPAGIAMVLAAAKLGKTTRECLSCGKTTPIAVLACPNCGASPRTKFLSGI
jgi:hypothetical protein